MKNKKQGQSALVVVIIVLVLALASVLIYFSAPNLLKKPETPINETTENTTPQVKLVSVSGIVDFAGLKPSEGDKEKVKIYYRKGSDEYIDTEISVPLQDNVKWVWDKAEEGTTYNFKAVLYTEDDKKIKDSSTIEATAPATEEVLVLNITWADLPDQIAKEYPVSISGIVIVNGYIPAGSKIYGMGRLSETETDFVKGMTSDAKSKTEWKWDKALNGRSYEIFAELVDAKGNILAKSNTFHKAAPYSDGNLTINSKAVPPVQKATITGTVRISGRIKDGSHADIHIRKAGTSEWQTVTSVSASTTSVAWEWKEAVAGSRYDVKAVLDNPDVNAEDQGSNTMTVTAPATDLLFKIDSGLTLKAPSDTPKLVECTKKDGQWRAKLKYEGVSGATKFWIHVGDGPSESNTKDSKYDAPKSTSSLELEQKVDKGKNYYTRYAYTNCKDCSSNGSYSSFSEELKFKCE